MPFLVTKVHSISMADAFNSRAVHGFSFVKLHHHRQLPLFQLEFRKQTQTRAPVSRSLFLPCATNLKLLFGRIDSGKKIQHIRRGPEVRVTMNMNSSSTSDNVVWMRILQDGVFRFDSTEKARDEAPPSLSFADPKHRDTPLDDNNSNASPYYIPSCSLQSGQQVFTMQLPIGTSFYGTGEVSGPLERTGQRVFSWNSDAWGYGPSTTSLYQSHPWVLAVLPDGRALGVLADTTQKCEIDLRRPTTIKFVAPAPFPVITFGPFPSPSIVVQTLSTAIGKIEMPPLWSLGYHQCRWSYEPDSKVLEVAERFRAKQIPCDVLWMDIDYMDEFRCFTFDKVKFSSPQKLASTLHSEGFKAVWMLDPGIKSEAGYFVYDSGSSQDVWILTPKGEPYVGEVWPGPCVFPDYTNSKTRKWWAELVKSFVPNGVDGIWNDMNEPTVFKTVTKTMPESNVHRGDDEVGGRKLHSYYHNVYGMLMARSTYEGMVLANPDKRPYVLTRAGYIGSHRYAATWTGDNLSTWEHLSMTIPMVLNLGISGQPFSGPDIGGFAGDATPKLFARWMGVGALVPFSRGHSEKGTLDHEPWSFGMECENICRLALERRYRLLPHIYTLFYNSHTTGEPVMTPLFFADPEDPDLRKIDDSFMLGNLLVSASSVKVGANTKQAKLPSGKWVEFDFDDAHEELPLLYLKGGSIIPSIPVIQNTGEMKRCKELTLIVALDDEGKAEGVLYEDDGDGYEYKKGKYLLTTYRATCQGDMLHVKVSQSQGHMERSKRTLNVHLLVGDSTKMVFSGVDGEEMTFKLPSPAEIEELVTETRKNKSYVPSNLADALETQDPLKGAGVPRTVMDVSAGEWKLKVVPWIGGRIISMIHVPTDIEWLWSRMDMSGYEEYSGPEYRSPGCTEEYDVLKQEIPEIGGSERLHMEGQIGGGLALQRRVFILQESPQSLQINSSLVAKSDFPGSGGFSRVACLRVHPTFQLRHPTDTFIKYTAVDGSSHCIDTDGDEQVLSGNERPNGEWMLVDKCANISLVNRFNLEEVEQCSICWGPGTCNLELWSPQRPVSKATPITINHSYETVYVS